MVSRERLAAALEDGTCDGVSGSDSGPILREKYFEDMAGEDLGEEGGIARHAGRDICERHVEGSKDGLVANSGTGGKGSSLRSY